MDVFNLDEAVIERYKVFARSFTDFRSPELSGKVDESVCHQAFLAGAVDSAEPALL